LKNIDIIVLDDSLALSLPKLSSILKQTGEKRKLWPLVTGHSVQNIMTRPTSEMTTNFKKLPEYISNAILECHCKKHCQQTYAKALAVFPFLTPFYSKSKTATLRLLSAEYEI
jgi:hypothetical protein